MKITIMIETEEELSNKDLVGLGGNLTTALIESCESAVNCTILDVESNNEYDKCDTVQNIGTYTTYPRGTSDENISKVRSLSTELLEAEIMLRGNKG